MSQQSQINALLRIFEELPSRTIPGHHIYILVPNEALHDIAVEMLGECGKDAEVRINKNVREPTYFLSSPPLMGE